MKTLFPASSFQKEPGNIMYTKYTSLYIEKERESRHFFERRPRRSHHFDT